jgi:AcrR family transcriptional regulator
MLSSEMGRPREHDAATRERLIDAATRISGEDGWDAVTVRAVAEAAGTSTRAVYALFGSKEGLEEELHLAMFRRLDQLLADAPRSDDPRADLVALANAYRGWATERPARYAALIRFMGPHAGPRSPEGLELARAAMSRLRDAIERGAAAGLVADRDVDAIAMEWRIVAHGLAEFENHGILGDPGEAWESLVNVIVDGHAPRRAGSPAT